MFCNEFSKSTDFQPTMRVPRATENSSVCAGNELFPDCFSHTADTGRGQSLLHRGTRAVMNESTSSLATDATFYMGWRIASNKSKKAPRIIYRHFNDVFRTSNSCRIGNLRAHGWNLQNIYTFSEVFDGSSLVDLWREYGVRSF